MDLNPDEVRIKQEMADACERVVCIADGTKWQRSALLSFVPPDGVHGIVTDTSAPEDQIEAWRARGVEVAVAEVTDSVRAPMQLIDFRPRHPIEERDH
jgi:DeoR/GlpR family transcriptional regulator of sugar metabolism